MARIRRLHLSLIVVLVLVALVGVLAALPGLLLNQATLKPPVEAAMRRALGRDLVLGGPVHVRLLPSPSITAEDVSLANRAGGSPGPMVHLQSLVAHIAWGGLFSRRVDVTRLELDRPEILLEIDADGAGNWQFAPVPANVAPPPPTQGASNGPGGAGFSVVLQELDIANGHIAWRDPKTGRDLALDVPSLAVRQPTPEAPMAVAGTLRVAEHDITLTAQTGPIARLSQAGGAPWPVQLAVSSQGATFAAQGSVADPVLATGLDLALTAVAPSLDRLAPFWPGAALPAWGPVQASTHLQIAQPGGPIALHGISLTTPGGNVSGDLTVTPGAHPALSGSLAADRLVLASLRDLLPRKAPPSAATPAPAPAPAAAPGWGGMIPDTPLDFAPLRAADANLALHVGALVLPGGQVNGLDAHLVLAAGKLGIHPITAKIGDAPLMAGLDIDATANPPAMALTLQGNGLRLETLLALAGQSPGVTGAADLDVRLKGAGETPHAMAGTLDGVVGLGVANGVIDAGSGLGAVFGLLQQAGLPPAGEAVKLQKTDLRCLAVHADLANGTARLGTILFDTPLAELDGGGTAQLGAETLALDLHGLLRVGGAGVMVPLRVGGTFRAPRAAVVGPGPGGRGITALLGALAPQATPDCAPALAAALGRPAPPAGENPPPATSRKPPNLGDVLRGLMQH